MGDTHTTTVPQMFYNSQLYCALSLYVRSRRQLLTATPRVVGFVFRYLVNQLSLQLGLALCPSGHEGNCSRHRPRVVGFVFKVSGHSLCVRPFIAYAGTASSDAKALNAIAYLKGPSVPT